MVSSLDILPKMKDTGDIIIFFFSFSVCFFGFPGLRSDSELCYSAFRDVAEISVIYLIVKVAGY